MKIILQKIFGNSSNTSTNIKSPIKFSII